MKWYSNIAEKKLDGTVGQRLGTMGWSVIDGRLSYWNAYYIASTSPEYNHSHAGGSAVGFYLVRANSVGDAWDKIEQNSQGYHT